MEWLEQQTLVFHISGYWEDQDQGAGRFTVCWEPSSLFAASCLLAANSLGERGRSLVSFFSYKGINFTMKAPPS